MDTLTKQDFAGCLRPDGTMDLAKLYDEFYGRPQHTVTTSYLDELNDAHYIRSTQVALAVVANARALEYLANKVA